MKSAEHFYFYVVDLHRRDAGERLLVEGLDFHSGLCAASPKPWGRELYVLDSRGHRGTLGKASMPHYSGIGYQLHWEGDEFAEYPCLLTTDPAYQKEFVLRVRFETGAYEPHEVWPPQWAVAVRGETWVGVVSDVRGREATLRLFTSEDHLPEPFVAFNPDWSDAIDEWIEGNFRFEVLS